MEKRKPAHDLSAFKAAVAADRVAFTRAAVGDARSLGLGIEGMKMALAALRHEQFYKSMTSIHDHRVWQDVYHLPGEGLTLYVKFTVAIGFVLLSFKEK